MDNEYKREIRRLIKERMLSDTCTNSVVRMMANAYLEDMDGDIRRSSIDNILNEHFDEFMLTLFKHHFKMYDETKKLLVDRIQNEPPAKIIVTTKEHYDRILEENKGRLQELIDENNQYDKIMKENKERYKKLREENNGRNVL